jgi:hypothetical protein
MAEPTREVRSLDDLAIDLESWAISRRKALKLGAAALVASTLGLIGAATDADAEPIDTERRGRCCRNRGRRNPCRTCCRRNREPCCGNRGCRCCRRNQTCNRRGRCR